MALRDNEDDCDLDPESTVQELLINEGKAAVDGLDQHVTIKVIHQQQAYSSRLSSTAPDLTPIHFRSSPRPAVPRFPQIESTLGKRPASTSDSSLVDHAAKRSRFNYDTALEENIPVASIETPPSDELDDDLDAAVSKALAPPSGRISPKASRITANGPTVPIHPQRTDGSIEQVAQIDGNPNKDNAIWAEEPIKAKKHQQPKVSKQSQTDSQVQQTPKKRKRDDTQLENVSSATALKPLDMLSGAVNNISNPTATSGPSQAIQGTVGLSPPEQPSQPSLSHRLLNSNVEPVATAETGEGASVPVKASSTASQAGNVTGQLSNDSTSNIPQPLASENPGGKATKLPKQKAPTKSASKASESVPIKSKPSVADTKTPSEKKPRAKKKGTEALKADIVDGARGSSVADHDTNLAVSGAEVSVSDPKPAAPKSRVSDLSTTDSPGEQLSGELQASHEREPMRADLSKASNTEQKEPKKRGRPKKETTTTTDVTGTTKQGIPKAMAGRMRFDAPDTDSSSAPKPPKPKKLSKKAQAAQDAAAAQNSSDTVRGSPEEPAKAAPASQPQTLPKESSQTTARILPPGYSEQRAEASIKDFKASHPPDTIANTASTAAIVKKPNAVVPPPSPPPVIADPKRAAQQATSESAETESESSEASDSDDETSSSTNPESSQVKTQKKPASKPQSSSQPQWAPRAKPVATNSKTAPKASTQLPSSAQATKTPVHIAPAPAPEPSGIKAMRAALKSTAESVVPTKSIATTKTTTKKPTLATAQDDDDDDETESETESEAETEVSQSKTAPKAVPAKAKKPVKGADAAAATAARPDMSIRNKSPDDEESSGSEEDESDDE